MTQSPSQRDAVRAVLGAAGRPKTSALVKAVAAGITGILAGVGLLIGSGVLVARAAHQPSLASIAGLLAAVELLAFLRSPLRFIERIAAHDVAFAALIRWRVWLFDLLTPLSPAGLRRRRSGDLLTRAIADVDLLQDLYLRVAVPGIVGAGGIGITCAIAFFVSPGAAALLCGAMVCAIAVVLAAGRALQGTSTDVLSLRGELAAGLVDVIDGAAELSIFGARGRALDELAALRAATESATRKIANIKVWATSALVALAGLTFVATVMIMTAHPSQGATNVLAAPLLTIGAFEAAAGLLVAAFGLDAALAAAVRLDELGTEAPKPISIIAATHLKSGPFAIDFDHVTLTYPEAVRSALSDVSLTIAPGEVLCVRGESGAGKSSLVTATFALWPLDAGEISFDGIAQRHLEAHEFRPRIGLSGASTTLFAGTIRDNLILARPDAGDASLTELVDRLGLGHLGGDADVLDTEVGEGGRRLSGGERQRLLLARALIGGASILLLDEPTAHLDADTAKAVATLVGEVRAGRTVVWITHDEEVLLDIDRTVVVEHGRVHDVAPPEHNL